MGATTSFLRKGNPLRQDLRWWVALAIGLVALIVGIYILVADQSARRNILFVVGVYLLFNGIMFTISGIRSGIGNFTRLMLARSAFGIAIGFVVVLNRFTDFMGINPTRVVLGFGFLGIGLTTLIGHFLNRKEHGFRITAAVGPIILVFWGLANFHQAANDSASDSSSSKIIGLLALGVGVAYCTIAFLRYQADKDAATR